MIFFTNFAMLKMYKWCDAKMEEKKRHWGRCRIISEIVYAVCKLLHLKGDYKINIVYFTRGDGIRKRGHAWVTCNDKDVFLTPSYRPHRMNRIGENEKYRYWISTNRGPLKAREE